jgi:hypothetical protein
MRELILADVPKGDVITTITGLGEDSQEYNFTVLQSGEAPLADLVHRLPGGDDLVGPATVTILGSREVNDTAGFAELNYQLDVNETNDDMPPIDGVIRIGRGILILDSRSQTVSPIPRGWHILSPAIKGINVAS